ncbi:MAG: hypothetical protein ABJ370_15910 [Paracoccaceae bacterium]
MEWQTNTSPFRDGRSPKGATKSHSNLTLYGVLISFLFVAAVLVLLQPRDTPITAVTENINVTPSVATIKAPDALPHVPAPPVEYTTRPPIIVRNVAPEDGPTAPAEIVTRNTPVLLNIPGQPASKTIARLLRQPIRLTDLSAQHRSLSDVAQVTLERLGHSASGATVSLQAMLVQALAEQQTDTYIDALINTAADQGHISVPVKLRDQDGRFNTKRLLDELIQEAR